jgi:hypothetical protein
LALSALFDANDFEQAFQLVRLGKGIGLAGAGFAAVSAVFDSAIAHDPLRFGEHIQGLRARLCSLVLLSATCTPRDNFFADLRMDPADAKLGFFLLNCVAMPGRTTLEIFGLSGKHDGGRRVSGLLFPRVSKLVALIFQLAPARLCAVWLESALVDFEFEEGDGAPYLAHMKKLLYKSKYLPEVTLPLMEDNGRLRVKPFKDLVGTELNGLLAPSGHERFRRVILTTARDAFDAPKLTHIVLRQLMLNFKAHGVQIVQQQLECDGYSETHAPRARLALSNLSNSQAGARQLDGDGGHTLATFRGNYMAHMAGSAMGLDDWVVSHLGLKVYCALLEDWAGMTAVAQASKAVLLPEKLELAKSSMPPSEWLVAFFQAFEAEKSIILNVGCGEGKTRINVMLAGAFSKGIVFMSCPTRALALDIEAICANLRVSYVRFSCELAHVAQDVRVVICVWDSALQAPGAAQPRRRGRGPSI